MKKMPDSWAFGAHSKAMAKMKRYLLRTYLRIARQDHGQCWCCAHDIQAGDLYCAEVWAIKNPPWEPSRKSLIQVRKMHNTCPEDPWEEKFRKEAEDDVSSDKVSNSEDKVA